MTVGDKVLVKPCSTSVGREGVVSRIEGQTVWVKFSDKVVLRVPIDLVLEAA